MKAHPTACFWAFMMCFTIVSGGDLFRPNRSPVLMVHSTGHGVFLHVLERQLCRPALLQRKIRSRDRSQCRRSHGIRNPDQVAVFALPSRTVRCIRGSPSRWPRHQPVGIPMDDTACSLHDERHDLHHLLRKHQNLHLETDRADNLQADSLEVLVIGQAFEGVPWGFFIANSPAYASEIVPLALRSACAATLQMSWAIGSIIVAGISYAYNQRDDQWSWRVPAALQWIFPVSISLELEIVHSILTCIASTFGPPLLRPRVAMVAHPPRPQGGSLAFHQTPGLQHRTGRQ